MRDPNQTKWCLETSIKSTLNGFRLLLMLRSSVVEINL